MTRRKHRGRESTALTRTGPAMPAHYGILRRPLFRAVPTEEVYRPHYGRQADLRLIDSAMRAANRGYMRPLTDLSLETLRLDGHTSSLWQKRLNRLASCSWSIEPAQGRRIDKGKAEAYADQVREYVEQIPHFRQSIMDLNWGTYHGRAASEIDWLLEGREWRPVGLNWIHARRLSFGPNRDVRVIDLTHESGNFQDTGYAIERVPYKFLVYAPRIFGDYPEREGLAPRAIFWSFFGRFTTRERLHLLEIFGKPWRIAIPRETKDGQWPNEEQLDDAFDQLNALGPHTTARLPVGMEVMISQPTKGAGDVHFDALDHSEKTLSKLFIGGTATTDAVSTGLGSDIGKQHRTAEDLIVDSDCWRLSELLEDQLSDAIIIVNHGPDEADHAPKFRLTAEAPLDRAKEAEVLSKILETGLDVSLAEARERTGVREIQAGEPFLRRIERSINNQIPLHLPLPQVIYPSGQAPDRGVIADIPITPGRPDNPGLGGENAPPAAGGAPGELPSPSPAPRALPAPSPGDGGDDEQPSQSTSERLAAEMTEHQIERCAHLKTNRCRLCGIERVHGLALDDDGAPVMGEDGEHTWRIEWRAIPDASPTPAPVNASSRRQLADSPAAVDVAGMHEHAVERDDEDRATMLMGGEHWHVFDIDGAFYWSSVSGQHEHACRDYGRSEGEHFHTVAVPGGVRETEVGGRHWHEVGVATTSTSGSHGHTLKLPDGRVAYSLTADEYAELVEDDDDTELGGGQPWAPRRRAASDVDETVQLLGVPPWRAARWLGRQAPESLYGSPDELVTRGVDGLAPITKALGDAIGRAVAGKRTARSIRAAIDRAASGFGTRRIAAVVEREIRMAAMLGALDAAWEAGNDKAVQVESFAELYGELMLSDEQRCLMILSDGSPAESIDISLRHPPDGMALAAGDGPKRDRGFTGHPLEGAIRSFLDRKPVTRRVFDKMTAEAKRQAFTVSGAVNREVVRTVKSELALQIAKGADLRDFKRAAAARLESAGWVPDNPSHVETVFRTNVARAYNDGRAKQMTQPEVLDARPYWQILGIGDDRQRETHGDVDGTVYEATDPVFATLFPPFDFNCRCRARSLSKRQAEAIGISDGSELEVVRNPKFKCGLGARAPG